MASDDTDPANKVVKMEMSSVTVDSPSLTRTASTSPRARFLPGQGLVVPYGT